MKKIEKLRNIFDFCKKKISPDIPIPPFLEISKKEKQEWTWFINGKKQKNITSIVGMNVKRGILWGYGVFEQVFRGRHIIFVGPVFAEVGGGGSIGIRYCFYDNMLFVALTWQTRFGIESREFPGGYREINQTAEQAEETEVQEEGNIREKGTSINLTEKYCPGLTSAYRYVTEEHPGISVFAREVPADTIDWTQSPPVMKKEYQAIENQQPELEFYRFERVRTMKIFRQADQHAALSLLEQHLIDTGRCHMTFS